MADSQQTAFDMGEAYDQFIFLLLAVFLTTHYPRGHI